MEYPFLDYEISKNFNEILEHKLIDLPEIKWLDVAGNINDPNYYKYHTRMGYPLEKCFIFKDKIMHHATG